MMTNFIDTLFGPVIEWLNSIANAIKEMSVPVARPINFGKYFGHFSFLGPRWITLITTVCTLGFTYMILFFVMSSGGLYAKFKNWIKWW